MTDLLPALVFLAVMLASTLAGMALRSRLPTEHVSDSSREAVLRSVGLVVTLASLVMAFLVTSAKAYYTSVESELTEISSDVAGLDRILVRFGNDGTNARELLREIVGSAVRTVWPEHPTSLPRFEGKSGIEAIEQLSDEIGALPGPGPKESAMRAQAQEFVGDIERSGYRLKHIRESRAQGPLLLIVVSWLVIIFMGFGLLTPRNRTTLTAMALAALAASGALFLIVELYSPVQGMIAIPPSTLEGALQY